MGLRIFQKLVCSAAEVRESLCQCQIKPGLALAFGSHELLRDLSMAIKETFPLCKVVGCTTAGEVLGEEIFDNSLSLTLVELESTEIREIEFSFEQALESSELGGRIASSLIATSLKHVFVLSDGLNINGSALVAGLFDNLPKGVTVTGGLAGDGGRFQETDILSSTGVSPKKVVAIGFYGDQLEVGCGSLGGWDPFGPERSITKSAGNILYELDGKPALPLYEEYLGDLAKELPASGLLFPLTIKVPGSEEPLVRTLLAVDRTTQSLIFAGDLPQGCMARLMKANTSRLIEGAMGAGTIANSALSQGEGALAILISCVGRRQVLKQRAEEELEAVREKIGSKAAMTGFYSYGEIAPFVRNARCELHNQTMTVTLFKES